MLHVDTTNPSFNLKKVDTEGDTKSTLLTIQTSVPACPCSQVKSPLHTLQIKSIIRVLKFFSVVRPVCFVFEKLYVLKHMQTLFCILKYGIQFRGKNDTVPIKYVSVGDHFVFIVSYAKAGALQWHFQ